MDSSTYNATHAPKIDQSWAPVLVHCLCHIMVVPRHAALECNPLIHEVVDNAGAYCVLVFQVKESSLTFALPGRRGLQRGNRALGMRGDCLFLKLTSSKSRQDSPFLRQPQTICQAWLRREPAAAGLFRMQLSLSRQFNGTKLRRSRVSDDWH